MKCPECGFENEEKARFCSQCGAKFKLLPEKEEKRIVTISFADLKGFTPLSEKLEPEEVKNIIDNIFQKLTEIVERNGGYVDKYIGDCIMALFGAPKSYGDDAERAVRSALEMQKKLKEFNREINEMVGVNLNMRIGINTGEVVTGFIGKKREGDWTVLGDTVNTAQRIESLCPLGKVLVSQSTYELTKRFFNFDEIPDISLKGKEKKLSLYKVLEYKKETQRDIEIIYEGSFIGREKEMNELLEQYYSAQNKSIFLFVTGEIGIGKTRLLAEFENRIKKKSSVYWIYPDPLSPSYLKGWTSFLLKFYPVKDFLYSIKSDEESLELGEYLDFSLSPLKFPVQLSSEKERKDLIFYAFARFIELLSKEKFPVYILENAHLLDETSREFLIYLSESFKEVPFLFIVSGRSSFYREMKLNTLKNFQTIEIPQLSFEETKDFLNRTLNIRKLPEEISLKIHENSFGNPLYIKNCIQFLLQEKFFEIRHKEIIPTKPSSSFRIPDTLKDFARAIIDRLEEEEKELLVLLSFLEERFDIDTVFALKDTKKILLKQKLEKLILLGILDTEKEKIGEIFRFKSPIYKETIMESLLLKTKSKLHNFVANRLEKMATTREDLYPIIAMNYEKAQEKEKSLFYYKKSLERAMRNLLYRESITYCEKIIEIAEDDETIHNTKFILSKCLKEEGELDKSEKIFEELWTKKDDKKSLFEFLDIIIDFKGEYKRAKKIIEEIIKKFPSFPDLPQLYHKLGQIYYHEENFEKTEKYYLKAIDTLEEESPLEGHILSELGSIYSRKNEFDNAIIYHNKALKCFKKYNDKETVARALENIGGTYYRAGKLDKGLEYHKKALRLAEKIRYKPGIGMSNEHIGYYYMNTGNYSSAMKYFKNALQIYRIFNMRKKSAFLYNNMAVIYTKQCLYKKAIESLNDYIKITKEMNILPRMIYGLYNQSRIYIILGDLEKAREVNNRTLELSQKMNLKDLYGACIANRGDISIIEGDFENCLKDYKESTKIFESINHTNFQLRNLLRLCRLYILSGDKEKSELFLQKSEELSNVVKDKEMEGEILILKSQFEEENRNKKNFLIQVIQIAQETRNYRLLLKALYFLSSMDSSFKDKFNVIVEQFTSELPGSKEKFIDILNFV